MDSKQSAMKKFQHLFDNSWQLVKFLRSSFEHQKLLIIELTLTQQPTMCSNHPVGLISSMMLAVTGLGHWHFLNFDPTTYCWRVLTPASFSFISDFISLSSRARRATLVLDKAMSAFNKSGSCFIEEVLVTEDTKKEITLHWPRSLRDTLHWQWSFYVALMLHHSNSAWESEITTSGTINVLKNAILFTDFSIEVLP